MTLLVLRVALAAMFVLAAASKLTDRGAFRGTLADFRVPPAFAAPLAFVVPIAELVIAGLLIPVGTATWAAWSAVALLAVFTTAAGLALARGERPDCGCFGTHRAPIGPATFARNGLFAAAAAVVALAGPGASIASASAEAIFGGIFTFALAALSWFCWQLFRQNGRLLQRVRALEQIGLESAHGDRAAGPALGVEIRTPPSAETPLEPARG